jgi:hypothetical protein
MDRKTRKYFGGWPGVEHIHYEGDYHVDGKSHLPLEELAAEVAKTQHGKTSASSASTPNL